MKYIAFSLLLATLVTAFPLEIMDITDTPRPSPAYELGQIDVIDYELEFRIDPDTTVFYAQTIIDYIKLSDDTILVLDFEAEELDTEWLHGSYYYYDLSAWFMLPVVFEDSILTINSAIDTTSEIGDTCRIAIGINHLPYSSGIYREASPDGPIVFTLFWPSLARRAFPCIDHPNDRATCTMKIMVPPGFTVAGGGELIDSTTSGDSCNVDWTFRYDEPICTYNISFAIGNYATIETTALDGALPVKSFAYPSTLTATAYDFARIPQMIELWDSLFGDYPFGEVGCVVTPMDVWGGTGGMEHQTLPNIGDGLITGSRTYEEVVAHELLHQWFGDCIGIAEWADFWLNEGIAVYSEVLWVEHTSGAAAAKTYMNGIESNYRTYATYYDDFPIYDPADFLSYIPYNKAACWWRMLRWMLGDEDFFAFLPYYFDRFAYKTVVTDSLAVALDDFTHGDWGWYFDQFIYEQGYPKYRFCSECREDSLGWFIDVHLKQIQAAPSCTLFTMPVPLQINTVDSTWEIPFYPDARAYTERIRVPDTVDYILFDQQNAICGTFTFDPTAYIAETRTPSELSISAFPNPFNGNCRLQIDDCGLGIDAIEVFDINGRRVAEIIPPDPPFTRGEEEGKSPLSKGDLGGLIWQPDESLGSGVYLVRARLNNDETATKHIVYLK